MDMGYSQGEIILSDGSSPSTDEDATLMLASANPKRRAGRKKFKETRHPVYRGIRQRTSVKWVCEVRQPKKQARIWLGTFPTAEMAARAHDVAVLALRGPHGACLNFSDSAWRLPVPVSCDTKDIQRAAAEAAELFRPVAKPVSSMVEETVMPQENNVFYLDEDVEFGMMDLMSDMYQGLLMSPPPMDSWSSTYGYDYDDDMDFGSDSVSLWSYSI